MQTTVVCVLELFEAVSYMCTRCTVVRVTKFVNLELSFFKRMKNKYYDVEDLIGRTIKDIST